MKLNLSPKTTCLETPHFYGQCSSLSRQVLLYQIVGSNICTAVRRVGLLPKLYQGFLALGDPCPTWVHPRAHGGLGGSLLEKCVMHYAQPAWCCVREIIPVGCFLVGVGRERVGHVNFFPFFNVKKKNFKHLGVNVFGLWNHHF